MTMLDTLPANYVLLDTETVTLDPGPGSVWEVAFTIPGRAGASGRSPVHHVMVQPDLDLAHPTALEVGGFHDRYTPDTALTRYGAAVWLADLLPAEAVLVGSNPTFDMAHLDMLDWAGGLRPPWHFHPIDLPAVVAGATGRWPGTEDRSLSMRWAAAAVGLHPDLWGDHTAAGDVAAMVELLRYLPERSLVGHLYPGGAQ